MICRCHTSAIPISSNSPRINDLWKKPQDDSETLSTPHDFIISSSRSSCFHRLNRLCIQAESGALFALFHAPSVLVKERAEYVEHEPVAVDPGVRGRLDPVALPYALSLATLNAESGRTDPKHSPRPLQLPLEVRMSTTSALDVIRNAEDAVLMRTPIGVPRPSRAFPGTPRTASAAYILPTRRQRLGF